MNRTTVAWLLGLALIQASTLLQAELLDQSSAGFTIQNSQTVAAPPMRVWHALVNDVGQWWPADHTWFGDASKLKIEPRAGGCFCEIDGSRQASHMRVAYVEPGKLLRMLGGLGPLQGMGLDGALEWRLEAVEGGTRITLWNRVGGYSPDDLSAFAKVVDAVQTQQLAGLANFLRGQ